MPATVEEVRDLIRSSMNDADVSGIGEENHRITGIVIWNGFKDLDASQRNQKITEIVRNKLGYKGTNVGFLMPLASKDEM